ncbi:MJ0042-type zinc finger domain-containing protein [Bradyrhizobium sp.]|uniref:MJ0042-type zinc finger domain-containing protein n=1 Tax=Bradyrhizobium sp. TaxID=376 RepID=UPI003C74CB17
MQIVCPHCTTSYAINLATFGAAGRTVRCSRCKEVWLARPEDAVEAAAPISAMAEAGQSAANSDAAAEWDALARQDDGESPPVVDSPSISSDWPAEDEGASRGSEVDWSSAAGQGAEGHEDAASRRRFGVQRLFGLAAFPHIPGVPAAGLPSACAAMGALILALVIWRADVVRLLPQTAPFYKMVGLEVNLRGLAFRDIKVTNEAIEGKPVLVIEGTIVGAARKPVELPRLRFSVRDAQGAEIYAWNAVLEQAVLKPGERALFKSRLASPPPEGRNIELRFFNKRDLSGGHA